MPAITKSKVEANTYLPRLAEGFVLGDLDFEDLLIFFREYAHLYTVGIDVNAVCNLNCDYCYLDSYNRRTAPIYADLEDIYRFVGDVAQKGVDLIALVGKEPFADERGIEVIEFLDKLSHHGELFRFGVVTNGTFIHRYIDRLPESIAYVDVSLDGVAEINDLARGVGIFQKATANMRRLISRGYQVWISSVLHRAHLKPGTLREFVTEMVSEHQCTNFYFSPVRNFTGGLQPFLLSFEEIRWLQEHLVEVAEQEQRVESIILDHPYEAVWRDYFWPLQSGAKSALDRLVVDGYGNVLDKLGINCYRKLDVFPHGPWATCRIDARGEYLPDVESRTFASPDSAGSICKERADRLFARALECHLSPMMARFLENMGHAQMLLPGRRALETVSMPTHNHRNV